MISPAGIRAKAMKYWDSQRFLKADLLGEPFFPLVIPFRSPSAGQLLDAYTEVREWIRVLREGSLEVRGYGYQVEYKTVNHRKLGSQLLPEKIMIPFKEDFLRLIGRQKEYHRFQECRARIEKAQPKLAPWIAANPLMVLKHDSAWTGLLAVCRFFQENKRPGSYLRELDIEGVDTKFIERHKSVLREMLDRILPEKAISSERPAENRFGFEQRFGLKHDLPLIRFRLLDLMLAQGFGMTDISTPITEFASLSIPCDRVFITENKVNGLSFPQAQNSMVIFGLGYGVHCLQAAGWLKTRSIVYWGDIDTHGFAMLSMIRGFFPQARSFLMDEETLLRFRHLWVEEPAQTRTAAALPHLFPKEQALYKKLLSNFFGKNVRLEQERIGFGWVRRELGGVFGGQKI